VAGASRVRMPEGCCFDERCRAMSSRLLACTCAPGRRRAAACSLTSTLTSCDPRTGRPTIASATTNLVDRSPLSPSTGCCSRVRDHWAVPRPDRERSGSCLPFTSIPIRGASGIGRALMNEARDRLTRLSFEEAILWVLVGNERAERFYRVDGWLLDGARRSMRCIGVTVDEVRYHRMLS